MGATRPSSHAAQDAQRTAKCAEALRAAVKALPRGTDYFVVVPSKRFDAIAPVHTVSGKDTGAMFSRAALNACVRRGWLLFNGEESGGYCYAITPEGHAALRKPPPAKEKVA